MKNNKKSKRKSRFPVLLFSLAAFVFLVSLFTILIMILTIYILMSTNFIKGPVDIPFTVLILVIVMSLIIGTVISALIINLPIKRVNEFLGGMRQVSDGDYSVRLTPRGPRILRNIYNQFNSMVQELNSVEILQSNFVNNFSHEFKTPIVSIQGFAKMLKRSDLDNDERNEYLDIIISESERLTNLSENVLALTKLENQTIITNKKEYNVSEQMRQVIAMMYGKYPEKNIEFQFDCDEFYIYGNEEMIQQIWINLIDNAMKFSKQDGIVKANIKMNNNETIVSISNEGETIPYAELDHIFNKFYQCDKSHTTAGNGLGLAIAKRIAELHNARIDVESQNDLTTFMVIFPI